MSRQNALPPGNFCGTWINNSAEVIHLGAPSGSTAETKVIDHVFTLNFGLIMMANDEFIHTNRKVIWRKFGDFMCHEFLSPNWVLRLFLLFSIYKNQFESKRQEIR